MKKELLIKKLIYVFVLLVVANVAYEGMRFYLQGDFRINEIISKTALELATLLVTGYVFLKK